MDDEHAETLPADLPAAAAAGSPWAAWSAARPPMAGIHLDTGAAGRSSFTTLEAATAHAYREAAEGAYVVAQSAAPTISELRTNLAALLGTDADGIAFTESAQWSLGVMLRVWPFDEHAEVAIAPSEWGPNIHAFTSRGMNIALLDVDVDGVIDLDALEWRLTHAPPSLVHVTQQASHRALRQPATDIARLCAAHGVPLWVDAAQTLGHCAVTPDAAVVYATSRKWLTGPRGIGILAIAEQWRSRLRIDHSPMTPPEAPLLFELESCEAHIAGRVGLAAAVGTLVSIGIDAVSARLDEVGRIVRHELADLANWRVVGPLDAPGAITAIEPIDGGVDVFAVRERLLSDHRIVTTACGVARAPREMTRPSLRISPHVDVHADHVALLRAALGGV